MVDVIPDDWRGPVFREDDHSPSYLTYSIRQIKSFFKYIDSLKNTIIDKFRVYPSEEPLFELKPNVKMEEVPTFSSKISQGITAGFFILFTSAVFQRLFTNIKEEYRTKNKGTIEDYHLLFYFAFLVFSYKTKVYAVRPTTELLDTFIGRMQIEFKDPDTSKYFKIVCFIHARFMSTAEISTEIFEEFNKMVTHYGPFLVCDEKLFRQVTCTANWLFVRTKPDQVGLWFLQAAIRTKRGYIFIVASSLVISNKKKKTDKEDKEKNPENETVPVVTHVKQWIELLKKKQSHAILMCDSHYTSKESLFELLQQKINFICGVQSSTVSSFTQKQVELSSKSSTTESHHDDFSTVTITPGKYYRGITEKFSINITNIVKKSEAPRSEKSVSTRNICEMYGKNFSYCDRFNQRLSYLDSNLEVYQVTKETLERRTITNYTIQSMLVNLFALYNTKCGEQSQYLMPDFLKKLSEGLFVEYLDEKRISKEKMEKNEENKENHDSPLAKKRKLS